MKKEVFKNDKAVIYCRVSSKEQEQTGYSLESQEKLLTEYAENNSFKTVKIYKISESASGRQIRKTFDEMIRYADKNNVPIILCEKIDRLTRNLKDAVTISDWINEDANREIHFVKENFIVNQNTRAHENLVWDMKIAIARFYTNNLSEEVKKGQKEKVAQGWLPTKPPLGYKTIGEKGHKIHVIDKDTAPYIKQMFEWYATGEHSTSSVTERLNKQGFRTRLGKKMSRSKTHALLTDPFYYGDFRWNGEIYKGKQEPIVSRELWLKVQDVLGSKNTGPKASRGQLFKSKIHCKHCGGVMTWYEQKEHVYGHCSYHGKSKGCKGKTCLREELVDTQVINIIESLAPANQEILDWIEEVIRSEYKGKAENREEQIRIITDQLKKVRDKKDKIIEAKILEEAPKEFCQRKIAEYYEQEKELEDDLSRVSDLNNDYQNLTIVIHELAYKAGMIYRASSQENKRLLMNELFNDLVQDKETIIPEFTEASKYLNTWMPIINNYYEQHKKMPEVKEFIALSGLSNDKVTKTVKVSEKKLRTGKYGLDKSKSTLSGTSVSTLLRE